jgi:hypothetical protein
LSLFQPVVVAAAKRCAAGTDAPPKSSATVRYTIEVGDGVARIGALDFQHGRLEEVATDARVSSCIRDSMAKTRWRTGGPDRSVRVRDSLPLGH